MVLVRNLRLIPILVCFGLAMILQPILATPASGQNLMQCMTKCIKHEGGNSAANRDTCKSRCANTATGGGKQRNCMAEFKSCRSGCGKPSGGSYKKCYRACKDRQMTCR